MENPTLEQIAATIRIVIQQEFSQQRVPKMLSDVWANEAEVLKLCGKGRKTLYNAIKAGKISAKDIRQNPLGKGYLFRRSALVKE
ncbi:helix-turn-helix domain-containing protein [Spirosoma koreense]